MRANPELSAEIAETQGNGRHPQKKSSPPSPRAPSPSINDGPLFVRRRPHHSPANERDAVEAGVGGTARVSGRSSRRARYLGLAYMPFPISS
jgi:hypothetical protein